MVKTKKYSAQALEQLIVDLGELAASNKDLALAALAEVPSEILLQALAERGGHPGVLAQAALLAAKKSSDYDKGAAGYGDIHNVDRTPYFPFGAVSYAQMLHTKSVRFNSIVKKILDGAEPNFEGLRDTALDIINYAGFFAADKTANGEG